MLHGSLPYKDFLFEWPPLSAPLLLIGGLGAPRTGVSRDLRVADAARRDLHRATHLGGGQAHERQRADRRLRRGDQPVAARGAPPYPLRPRAGGVDDGGPGAAGHRPSARGLRRARRGDCGQGLSAGRRRRRAALAVEARRQADLSTGTRDPGGGRRPDPDRRACRLGPRRLELAQRSDQPSAGDREHRGVDPVRAWASGLQLSARHRGRGFVEPFGAGGGRGGGAAGPRSARCDGRDRRARVQARRPAGARARFAYGDRRVRCRVARCCRRST